MFFCVLALFAFAFPSLASASGLMVYPMEQFVRSSKPTAYVAKNNQERAIAVEVTVEKWSISEDGKELREATQDLVAFPPQFILKGNTSKRIKVGPRSRKPVDTERAYRVTIRELPINFEVPEDQVNQVYMANAYRTSFYLQPRRQEAILNVVGSGFENNKLWVVLQNEGNTHTHVQKPELSLTLSDGETIQLEENALLDSIAGQNLHAKMTRRFTFDLEELMKNRGAVKGAITLRSGHDGETKSFPLFFQ